MAVDTGDRPILVITGGSGRVAQRLVEPLAEKYRVRLVDRKPPDVGRRPPGTAVAKWLEGDLASSVQAAKALEEAAAVVHLAGHADPRMGWDEAYRANISTTRRLLDAAAKARVPRVVLASSVHAIGEYNRLWHRPVPSGAPPRPCCPYGQSKAVIEALGRLHAEETGASVICLRLGLVGWPLTERRYLGMWLSDGDAARLFKAALTAPVRYGTYVGVSANTRNHWDLTLTRDELGYHPRDDSEPLADQAGPPKEELSCRLFGDAEDPTPRGAAQ